MSNYEKQNFVSGQILKAEHLNHMEDGIGQLSEEKLSIPTTDSKPDHGTAGQFAVSDGKGGIVWKTLVEAEEVSY